MIKLSLIDTVYLAAMMDGEGTIAISRHRKSPRHNYSYGLFVTVTNTSLTLLDWIRSVTQIGVISPKPRQKEWKLCHQWNLRAFEIKDFLEAVLPYMRVRHKQAHLMLEFIKGTRYTGPHYPLTVSEIVDKEMIFEEMLVLNKRGA